MATPAHSLLTALTHLLPYKARRIARAAVAIGSAATTKTPAPAAIHRSFRLTVPKRATKPAAATTTKPAQQSTPYPVNLPADAKLIQQLQTRIAKLEAEAAAQHAPAATTTPATPAVPAVDTPAEDAVLALQSLGISVKQARVLVGAARTGNPTADTAELVRLALPQCGRVQAQRFNYKKD